MTTAPYGPPDPNASTGGTQPSDYLAALRRTPAKSRGLDALGAYREPSATDRYLAGTEEQAQATTRYQQNNQKPGMVLSGAQSLGAIASGPGMLGRSVAEETVGKLPKFTGRGVFTDIAAGALDPSTYLGNELLGGAYTLAGRPGAAIASRATGAAGKAVSGVVGKGANWLSPSTAARGVMPTGGMAASAVPAAVATGLGDNVVGLRDITAGLTREQQIANIARRTVGAPLAKVGLHPFVEDNPFAQAALGEKARVRPIIESQANILGATVDEILHKNFQADKQGRIAALAGLDPSFKGAPTIQDVAARLPTYAPHLTPEQVGALAKIEQAVKPYGDLLGKVGVPVNTRSDVVPGGFYLPRGSAAEFGADAPVKVAAGAPLGGRKGFERAASFGSQSEGIDKGFEYPTIREALQAYGTDAGTRATDAHVANFLKGAIDPATGKPIAEAIPAGGTPARDQGLISKLPGLQGYTWADDIANAANKALRQQGPIEGQGSNLVRLGQAINNLGVGLTSTADNSWMAIQGLLGAANDPKAYAQALKANIQAWGPGGDRALGKFINNFDRAATSQGRADASLWASKGNLHVGSSNSEFTFNGAKGLTGKIAGAPVIRQSNRAFGTFGDAMRLNWADDMLGDEMRGAGLLGKGPRTLQQIVQSGDLAKIGDAVNNMTGWAKEPAFKGWGELALYAPRFLESRFETVAKAAGGIRPGAPIDQRIARQSILKLVGAGTLLTVGVNAKNGHDTDFRPMVDGKRNPNFVRARILGRDVSFFGPWDSLVGAIISTAAGKPADAARSLSSPLVSHAWDIISNRDFNGAPVRDNPEEFAKYLLTSNLPFSSAGTSQGVAQAAQGAVAGDQGKVAEGGAAAAESFAGLKSNPLSRIERLDVASGGDARAYEKARSAYAAIPTNPMEAAAKKGPTRAEYLKANPDVDAKLFLTNQVDTLSTPAARASAVRLMTATGLATKDIRSLTPKPFESIAHGELRLYLQKALGEPYTSNGDPKVFAFEKLYTDSGYGDIEAKYPALQSPTISAKYAAYKGLDAAARLQAFSGADLALMRSIEGHIAAAQQQARRANPALDAGLVRYSMGGTAETPEGRMTKYMLDKEAAKKAA